jgi:hypothetical protein
VTSNTQDALAALRKWRLEQDNSGPFRVYRDQKGEIYHSVTHILKETSDKSGLERWEARLGPVEATQQRNVAATRGNMAHSQAEYLLKTSQQLARNTANKRNAIRWDDQGLARIPVPITQWALKRVRPNVPRVGWSAAGYARGLSDWIAETSPRSSPPNFPFITQPALLEHVTPWWDSATAEDSPTEHLY